MGAPPRTLMVLRPAAALLLALAALPTGAAAPKDSGVDVLLEEGTYRFDARGAATFTHRLVYRPHAPDAARRWARVERSWAPWYQARPEDRKSTRLNSSHV